MPLISYHLIVLDQDCYSIGKQSSSSNTGARESSVRVSGEAVSPLSRTAGSPRRLRLVCTRYLQTSQPWGKVVVYVSSK
jgi:hypothetical protein